MLTDEQQLVVDTALSNPDKVIAVNSIAGSGKTATAEAVIRTYKPKKGFYTAFNRAVVEEAQRRFGTFINAKTLHALAYMFVKPKKVEEFTYSSITDKVNYYTKSEVIRVLDSFFRSSYLDIDDYLDTVSTLDNVKILVPKYADMMLQGKINPSFNFLLKCLHMMLAYKDLELEYDLFVFDEVQDVIPVTLEIFKLINAKTKIVFGDRFQNIYSFMDTVNAFEELDDVNEIKLTKSFRCIPDIADKVEQYGIKYLDEEFKYRGNDSLTKKDGSSVYLARYNATLIERIYDLIKRGISFRTSRGIDTIFELPLALLTANSGGKIYNKKYKFLETEYYNFLDQDYYKRYFEYIYYVVDDGNINHMIDIIRNFYKRDINIYNIYNTAKKMIDYDADITLSTAHSFKGLEADTVFMEHDLDESLYSAIKDISIENSIPDLYKFGLTKAQKETLNLYYVALSRARYNIQKV